MFIPMEEGEGVVLKVHRHWLFIVVRIVGLALLFLVPAAVLLFLGQLGIIILVGADTAALVALWALWGLVCWAMFWQFWTTYYMDIWVVTNRRIIDIDYQRLFDRSISILRLEKIQDVDTRVQGVLGTLLRYGSVIVQTAGTKEEFVIDQISEPEHLRDVISRLSGARPSITAP